MDGGPSLVEGREDGELRPYPLPSDSPQTLDMFDSFLIWELLVAANQERIDESNERYNQFLRHGEQIEAWRERVYLQLLERLDTMLWGQMEAREDEYFRASRGDCPCELNIREEYTAPNPLLDY